MILSWRYNVSAGPSGFWSPDMLNTYVWQKPAGRFVGIPFCTAELNRMQLVSQVQPDILIHALFMQHNGKQKLNQIIHIVYEVLQVNTIDLFLRFRVCAVFVVLVFLHIQWQLNTLGMDWGWCPHRLCRCAFVSSSLCQVYWGHRAPTTGFVPTWSWMGLIPFGAIIDVYNLCDTRGKLMLPNIRQVFNLFIHNLLSSRILQLECVKLDRFGILHLQIDTCTSKPLRTWNRPFVSWLDHVGSKWLLATGITKCQAIFLWMKVNVRCYWGRIIYLDELSHGRLSRLWAK